MIAMKRAMDDGLDCEFHIKVSGPKSLAKAIDDRDAARAEAEKAKTDLLVAMTDSAALRDLVGELVGVLQAAARVGDDRMAWPMWLRKRIDEALARARKVHHG